MNAYTIRFTGRPLGAIGTFNEIEASRYANNPEEAVQLLAEPMPIAFERAGPPPDVKAIQAPFDHADLVRYVSNDAKMMESVAHHVAALVAIVSRAANACREENAQWHDDPEGPEHGIFHAPVECQYPATERIVAVAELVLYRLRETPAGLTISDKLQLKEGGAS